jgi:hypothetical protein
MNVVLISKIPHAARSVNRSFFEYVGEPYPDLKSLVAESGVQPQKRLVAGIEAKAESDIALHVAP